MWHPSGDSCRENAVPCLSAVIAREKRAIQYAAAYRLKLRRLWNTGSPGPALA
jgi:hypothetical protein